MFVFLRLTECLCTRSVAARRSRHPSPSATGIQPLTDRIRYAVTVRWAYHMRNCMGLSRRCNWPQIELANDSIHRCM